MSMAKELRARAQERLAELAAREIEKAFGKHPKAKEAAKFAAKQAARGVSARIAFDLAARKFGLTKPPARQPGQPPAVPPVQPSRPVMPPTPSGPPTTPPAARGRPFTQPPPRGPQTAQPVVIRERRYPSIPRHGPEGFERIEPPTPTTEPRPSPGTLVIGAEFRAPHTLRTKKGKPCRTDRWFDRMGLVYDAGLPDDARGGYNDPWLWVGGSTFRVYYPGSTRADFAAMFSSGSTGRWLNAWSQKSSYVSF
jgi:hypothetical protein